MFGRGGNSCLIGVVRVCVFFFVLNFACFIFFLSSASGSVRADDVPRSHGLSPQPLREACFSGEKEVRVSEEHSLVSDSVREKVGGGSDHPHSPGPPGLPAVMHPQEGKMSSGRFRFLPPPTCS